MAKYSFEPKKKMVEEYFECKGGYGYLEKKYNINYSQIRKWIKVYEKFGDEGPKLIEYIFNLLKYMFFYVILFKYVNRKI